MNLQEHLTVDQLERRTGCEWWSGDGSL